MRRKSSPEGKLAHSSEEDPTKYRILHKIAAPPISPYLSTYIVESRD
jgi:hypothetical protein